MKRFLLAVLLSAGCGGEGSNPAPMTIAGMTGGGAGSPVVAMGAAGRAGAAVGAAGMPAAGAMTTPRAGMTGGAGMGTAQQAGGGGMAGASPSGAAGAAGGGTAGAAGAPPSSGGAGGSSGTMPKQALPPVTDYTQKGPFKTTMTSNTGPENKFTIFRPEPLGMDGFVHSPIIFGPGIITTPSNYRTFLDHLASHGFVTICANSLTGGPNDPGNLKAMQTGLDWLIEQNGQSGVFQGKLAVDRAITMGYSIGSTASIQLSNHKAVMTTVAIHGHNTKGDPHGPVLLLTGTEDVINDVRMTLTTLEEAPAVLMALPIGHLDVLGELAAGGRYVGPITAWLRFWVNGDTAAKSFFWGSDCKMCASPWITPEANAKWKAQML